VDLPILLGHEDDLILVQRAKRKLPFAMPGVFFSLSLKLLLDECVARHLKRGFATNTPGLKSIGNDKVTRDHSDPRRVKTNL